MPTTFRFLIILVFLAMVAYGVMFTLAALVQPQHRPMSIPIAHERLDPAPDKPGG